MRRAELTAKNRNPEIDSINVEWLVVRSPLPSLWWWPPRSGSSAVRTDHDRDAGVAAGCKRWERMGPAPPTFSFPAARYRCRLANGLPSATPNVAGPASHTSIPRTGPARSLPTTPAGSSELDGADGAEDGHGDRIVFLRARCPVQPRASFSDSQPHSSQTRTWCVQEEMDRRRASRRSTDARRVVAVRTTAARPVSAVIPTKSSCLGRRRQVAETNAGLLDIAGCACLLSSRFVRGPVGSIAPSAVRKDRPTNTRDTCSPS